MYDFIARNSTELSVQQGETLEVTTPATSRQMGCARAPSGLSVLPVGQVIESSKRWWKCRNSFNQVGFVPFNILQPTSHVESPVSSRPPSVRPAHMTCCAQAWTLLSVNSRLLSDPPHPIPSSCRLPSRRPSRRLSPPSHPALRFCTPQTPRSVRAAYHLTASTDQLRTTRKTKVPACWACVCLGVTGRESKDTQVSKVCPDWRAFSLQKKQKMLYAWGNPFLFMRLLSCVYCQLSSFLMVCSSRVFFQWLTCYLLFAAMLVNDELLHRLTNGKANLNKPLFIQRSSETAIPLDFDSSPEEVADWLRGKGFSDPWVQFFFLSVRVNEEK